jgi:hypothetical protein
VAKYEFIGADPIDHFRLGHVEPGQVVECDEQPPGPWKSTRKRKSTTEPGSDESDTPEEG